MRLHEVVDRVLLGQAAVHRHQGALQNHVGVAQVGHDLVDADWIKTDTRTARVRTVLLEQKTNPKHSTNTYIEHHDFLQYFKCCSRDAGVAPNVLWMRWNTHQGRQPRARREARCPGVPHAPFALHR